MKRPSLKSRKPKKARRFLRGRQFDYRIYETTATNESNLELPDITNFTPRGDDVQGFVAKWDDVLLSMKETPSEEKQKSMYRTRLRHSEQLKTTFAVYNQDTAQKNEQHGQEVRGPKDEGSKLRCQK